MAVPDKEHEVRAGEDAGDDGKQKVNSPLKQVDSYMAVGVEESAQQERGSTHSKDDPATHAASEGIKHTSISDGPLKADNGEVIEGITAIATNGDEDIAVPRRSISESKQDAEMLENPSSSPNSKKGFTTLRELTPDSKHDAEMLGRISSPKKKRGRDQDDDEADTEAMDGCEGSSSPDGHTSRSVRSAPEKKRHRDDSQEPARSAEKETLGVTVGVEKGPWKSADTTTSKPTEPREKFMSDNEEKKEQESGSKEAALAASEVATEPATISPDAFKKSGFGALAGATTSGFGTFGANQPSIFATSDKDSASNTNTPTASGFGSLAANKPSVFGGGASTTSVFSGGSKPVSGFGTLGGGNGTFGSVLSNGFSMVSGAKLTSFAALEKGSAITESRPVRAFGAPDSEKEDSDSDGDDNEGGPLGSGDEETGKPAPDDKKTVKFSKVQVDTGETDEITLLSLRARLYALASREIGWKERGVGTLKLNVHKDSIETYPNGEPVPDSFDASAPELGNAPPARLVMRQENTHRVILNTLVYKTLDLKERPATSGTQLMFVAMEVPEGGSKPKPIQMLLKMKEDTSKQFREHINQIKDELQQASTT